MGKQYEIGVMESYVNVTCGLVGPQAVELRAPPLNVERKWSRTFNWLEKKMNEY